MIFGVATVVGMIVLNAEIEAKSVVLEETCTEVMIVGVWIVVVNMEIIEVGVDANATVVEIT